MQKRRILSGMQPSGRMHLGNLIGALDNWKKLQDQYESFFFIADWHALTSMSTDTSMIRENTRDMLIDWLSAGLDPEKSIIFIQSRMPEHAELHLLLSMITPVSWLERVPTYKEKQQEVKDRDLSNYGFLGYPVLQSADILIYKSDFVPVGIDQLPHLELTREIARRFNHLYGDVFIEPEALLTEVPKLPGTDGRKMSKSYENAIYLSDAPDVIEQKFKTMVTDPARVKRTDAGNPEVCPVFVFHRVYTPEIERNGIDSDCRTASIGCIDCKRILFRNIMGALEPVFVKRKELLSHPGSIDEIIDSGVLKARDVASRTMFEVREAMKI
ncbi:MAG: tryptophan--tRNA ligase [Nitrospirota bacterium]